MVRTADSSVRVGGKAPKKGGNSTSTNGSSRSRSPSSSGERGFSSYNSVCQRETPNWQKPITTFFTHIEKTSKQDTKQSTSKQLESDINMVDDDENQQLQANTNDETMEQEYTQLQVDSGSSVVNEEDKENLPNQSNDKSSNENMENHDMEMNEINEITKKKVNLRDDDDEDAAPKKKRKLDANMFKQLKKLEQAEVMFS